MQHMIDRLCPGQEHDAKCAIVYLPGKLLRPMMIGVKMSTAPNKIEQVVLIESNRS